jgi:hypothetical protein
VFNGVPKGFHGLRRNHGFAAATDRGGNHDRQLLAVFFENFLDGHEGGFGVQRIENGFDQQEIRAAGNEAAHLAFVVGFHLVERDHAKAGIVRVG